MAKKKPEERAETYEFEKVQPQEEAEVEIKKEVVDKADYDNLSDRYLRLLADFENFKRRNAENGKVMYRSGKLDMIDSILPTLDYLDMAIAAIKDDSARQGVELVKKAFADVLAREGVKEYDPMGEDFDPKKHEAVMSREEEGKEGKILQVLKKGYLCDDKVLRHPMVVVGK